MSKACKIVVHPHAKRKASGEPYHTQTHAHPVSQRGWRDAVRQAEGGAIRGESSTIFLSCPRGDIRIAQCSDINTRSGGRLCALDAAIGGSSTRVLADALGNDGQRRVPPPGAKREPPPVFHTRQGPPPGVPTLKGRRRR